MPVETDNPDICQYITDEDLRVMLRKLNINTMLELAQHYNNQEKIGQLSKTDFNLIYYAVNEWLNIPEEQEAIDDTEQP